MTDSLATFSSIDASQRLERDGFVVFDRFLDANTVNRATTSLRSMSSDSAAARMRRDAVFAHRNLLRHAFVHELIQLDIVQSLVNDLSPGSIPVRAILFDKTGDANWTVPWHQDRSIAVRERVDLLGFGPWSVKAGTVHVQPPVNILRQMLTLRFHVDACSPDNGPLRVIPGSHRAILTSDDVAAAARDEQVSCTTDVGGLVVMRPLLLHASSPATRPTHRRVIHVEFGPRDLPTPLQWAIA